MILNGGALVIKGINTAGQALHLPQAAAYAASREVLNPSVPHSLDHARVSTVAISLRSSINNDREIIYKRLLSVETSDGIIHECINNKNVGYLTVETEKNYYVSYKESEDHPDYMHGEYYDFSNPLSQETYKITVEIVDRKIALDIENKFKESKLISFFGENWHRFVHKEAEKIDAIHEIAKHENIAISEITAFGDDYNDIEMVKNCGVGIAMENGIEEIKQVAKYICGKNNEDGIGKWIEKNLL
ncbi:MAG: HAD family hydrolase [Spirochaetaceae bacterium]|nr:HAD family hydrolase [Spirochaetaceae bacterium]